MTNLWIVWNYVAAAYGQGEYSDALYSQEGATDGGLVNTGTAIMLFVAIASALIFLGIVIRFWKRPHRDNTQEQK